MLGPIAPLNVGSSGNAAELSAWMHPLRGGLRADTTPIGGAPESSSAIGQTMSLTKVHSEVAQLLQGVGGGLENNKVLQMMIALLVLLALLDESLGQAGAGSNALGALSRGSAERPMLFSASVSSTTIMVQQTSMTLTASGMDVFATLDDQAQPQGGKVDLAA